MHPVSHPQVVTRGNGGLMGKRPSPVKSNLPRKGWFSILTEAVIHGETTEKTTGLPSIELASRKKGTRLKYRNRQRQERVEQYRERLHLYLGRTQAQRQLNRPPTYQEAEHLFHPIQSSTNVELGHHPPNLHLQEVQYKHPHHLAH